MTEKRYVVEAGSAGEFERLVRDYPEFAGLLSGGEGALSLFPYVFQDIYYSLFREKPRLVPLEHLSTGARLNRSIPHPRFSSGARQGSGSS